MRLRNSAKRRRHVHRKVAVPFQQAPSLNFQKRTASDVPALRGGRQNCARISWAETDEDEHVFGEGGTRHKKGSFLERKEHLPHIGLGHRSVLGQSTSVDGR